MTDEQRDPEADGPEDATEPETSTLRQDGDVDDIDDDFETLSRAEVDSLDNRVEPPVDRAIPSGPAGVAGRRRTKGAAGKNAPAPTAADEAVRIQDRVSAYFVVASVGVFVVILAWGLLLGRAGLMSDMFATPRPARTPVTTIAPSSAPSVEPSVSPSASASSSPSASASSSPSASTGAASPSVTPESPSPSAS